LPPVQQGREFYSLDTAGNAKTKKKPVEMGFHGSPSHVELSGDFGVVAALQKVRQSAVHGPASLLSFIRPSPQTTWRLYLSILLAPTLPL
jgi:hypothetical protein